MRKGGVFVAIVPKRKTSKARRDKRRSFVCRLTPPAVGLCGKCGEYKLLHRVCANCGDYENNISVGK